MPRILVIDDDALMRKLVDKVLTATGHEVFQAGNGKEGLKQHRADPVDLIITDIFMPEMEGLEFIRTLLKKNPEVPVIAMSGNKHLELAMAIAWTSGVLLSK